MAKKFRLKVPRLVKRRRRRRNPASNSLLLLGGAGLVGLYALSQRSKTETTPTSGPGNTNNQPTKPTTGATPVPDNIYDLMIAAFNANGKPGAGQNPAGKNAWIAAMQSAYYMPASSWAWVWDQSVTYRNETGSYAGPSIIHSWVVQASQF